MQLYKDNTMTKEQFLLDALEYYTADVTRRNVNNIKCRYHPLHERTQGCMIGRHLPKEGQIAYDNYEFSAGWRIVVKDILNGRLPDYRPEWMQGMDTDFLVECQRLHDYFPHWDKDGLSHLGRIQLSTIIRDYNLNPDTFAKFLRSPNP